MEMNEKNNFRIFFHFLPLSRSFNGGNESIPLFESLSGMEWNG